MAVLLDLLTCHHLMKKPRLIGENTGIYEPGKKFFYNLNSLSSNRDNFCTKKKQWT
jgi:hypothetical protein